METAWNTWPIFESNYGWWGGEFGWIQMEEGTDGTVEVTWGTIWGRFMNATPEIVSADFGMTLQMRAVPEPATVVMMCLGLVLLISSHYFVSNKLK